MVRSKLTPVEAKLRRSAIRAKVIGQFVIWAVLILMYIPILVLIAYSFNLNDQVVAPWVSGAWDNASFDGLYIRLFQSDAGQEIMTALGNTIIIALVSSILSTVLGTCGAIGVFYSGKKARAMTEGATQISVANAEIVVAMSLVVMFVFLGTYVFGGANLFSFGTLIIGHMVLSLPFVYLSVKPKLQQMDPALYEAALDLGCNQPKAMFKVILPEILPGILSGFLLSITLSLDDFIVTAFTRGAGLLSGEKTIETLSTLVQAKIKKGPVPPEMRALTTFIFLFVLLIVVGITIYQNVAAKRHKSHAKGREI